MFIVVAFSFASLTVMLYREIERVVRKDHCVVMGFLFLLVFRQRTKHAIICRMPKFGGFVHDFYMYANQPSNDCQSHNSSLFLHFSFTRIGHGTFLRSGAQLWLLWWQIDKRSDSFAFVFAIAACD